MSRLTTLVEIHIEHEKSWATTLSSMFGASYKGAPAFSLHVYAYNLRRSTRYGNSIAQGLDFYVMENGLCLD